jgi:Na+-driven multidrug efflux pump
VEALAMVAFFALSAVANPFAAQNAGAGRMERVRAGMRVSLLFCAGFGAAAGLLLWLLGPQVARLFSGDPAVVASTALHLSLMPWGFGAVGAIAVASAAFNGLERPLPALALSLARTLAVGVPAAWLGGRLAGEAGTLLGILLTNLAVGAAAASWVLRATAPAAAATLPSTRTEARRHAA